jgi:hypothetical protein
MLLPARPKPRTFRIATGPTPAPSHANQSRPAPSAPLLPLFAPPKHALGPVTQNATTALDGAQIEAEATAEDDAAPPGLDLSHSSDSEAASDTEKGIRKRRRRKPSPEAKKRAKKAKAEKMKAEKAAGRASASSDDNELVSDSLAVVEEPSCSPGQARGPPVLVEDVTEEEELEQLLADVSARHAQL